VFRNLGFCGVRTHFSLGTTGNGGGFGSRASAFLLGKLRAAVYARYSTDPQREASVDNQFRACARQSKPAG
jgi:hypothetical protein